MLTSEKFMAKAKEIVRDYINEHLDKTDNIQISIDDVYVVWYSFILGNQKALISSTVPNSQYYEVTYNNTTNEIYFDAYVKIENKCYDVNIEGE